MHVWIRSSWFLAVVTLGAILLKVFALPFFAAGARFAFLFVADAGAGALILFVSGEAGDGSALAAAGVLIEIPVGRAGLVLGALASTDGVVFPAEPRGACTFFNAFALAGVPIIEGGG